MKATLAIVAVCLSAVDAFSFVRPLDKKYLTKLSAKKVRESP